MVREQMSDTNVQCHLKAAGAAVPPPVCPCPTFLAMNPQKSLALQSCLGQRLLHTAADCTRHHRWRIVRMAMGVDLWRIQQAVLGRTKCFGGAT